MNKRIVLVALLLFTLAIAFGAFGAHGLKSLVSEKQMQTFEVGVRYQFYTSLALMITAFNSDKLSFSLAWIFGWVICGILLFSGSIFLLSLHQFTKIPIQWIGPITPLGGALMIIGWGMFIIKLFRS